jgi:heat shock protein HslJ
MRIALLLGIAVIMMACSSSQANLKPDANIYDTRFVLKTLNGAAIKLDKDAFLTISSEAATISGNAGCNTFNGPVAVTEESLIFENLVATKMACPNMKTEEALMKMLSGSVTYAIKGDMLTLTADGGAVAEFEAVALK